MNRVVRTCQNSAGKKRSVFGARFADSQRWTARRKAAVARSVVTGELTGPEACKLHDLSQEEGELTPTLKLKRNVVYERYAQQFDDLYA